MTQELIERLEPCPFCRSQMQLGLQMFKHPAMDDGECPLQDLAFRNELVGAWNTRDQSQSARIAELEGDWQLIDESAPHACHVLAARFDDSFGEWIYGIVLSPPSKPFTHWKPLPEPPPISLTKDSTSAAKEAG